jgi:lysophospholipase L1-like esterase
MKLSGQTPPRDQAVPTVAAHLATSESKSRMAGLPGIGRLWQWLGLAGGSRGLMARRGSDSSRRMAHQARHAGYKPRAAVAVRSSLPAVPVARATWASSDTPVVSAASTVSAPPSVSDTHAVSAGLVASAVVVPTGTVRAAAGPRARGGSTALARTSAAGRRARTSSTSFLSRLSRRLTPQEPRRRETTAILALLLIACVASVAGTATHGASARAMDVAVADPTIDTTFGDLHFETYAPDFKVTPTPKPTAKPKPKVTPYNGPQLRFVAIGDSLTAWPTRYNWPHCLDVNDQKAILVHNAGVTGNLTSEMRARFSRDVIAYKPKFVMIMGGTNDISDRYGIDQATVIANLKAMVRSAKAAKITPILMAIPPQQSYGSVAKVKSLNAAIYRLANNEKIYYVDSYGPLATSAGVIKDAYTTDGLHLSYAGAQAVGNAAWRRVRRIGL